MADKSSRRRRRQVDDEEEETGVDEPIEIKAREPRVGESRRRQMKSVLLVWKGYIILAIVLLSNLFLLIYYVPGNNFLVMLGCFPDFLG